MLMEKEEEKEGIISEHNRKEGTKENLEKKYKLLLLECGELYSFSTVCWTAL